jgi:hypothetical protein
VTDVPTTHLGTRLRDAAVELVDAPLDAIVDPAVPKVTARIEVAGIVDPVVPISHAPVALVFRCPRCGADHRHGVVSLPALVYGACGTPVVIDGTAP